MTSKNIQSFQEHKLCQGRTERIKKEVWAKAHWIVAPAVDGAHSERNQAVEAGRGGVALGLNSELVPFLITEGIASSQRAVWACLDHPTWGKIGFTSIYGPNDGASQTALWNELALVLDPAFKWLLMGDFNMVEAASDLLGGDGGPIWGREARAWSNLVCKCSLLDSFQARAGHLCFSWDNHQCHRHNPATGMGSIPASRTLCMLDRIYALGFSRTFPFNVESTILPGFSLSDHALVLALIKCGELTRKPSRHRMNVAHLGSAEFRARLSCMWERQVEFGSISGWTVDKIMVNCLAQARLIERCWGKRRAIERRQRRACLLARLSRAQLAIERAPS